MNGDRIISQKQSMTEKAMFGRGHTTIIEPWSTVKKYSNNELQIKQKILLKNTSKNKWEINIF